ncbi:MAG: preprotein translocase subunit SecY [Planctomycetota bacterium]|jgi:preprotein translocase subunit SecY
MIQAFIETIQNILKIPELRKKIGMTFALLVVYRLGFKIPLPGVDPTELKALAERLGGSGLGALFKLADLVSGGGFLSFTLFSLGIMPYISAAIIFQLLTKVVPKLEEISKEGASGRQKIEQYTKYATILICLVQGTMVVQHLASPAYRLVPNPTLGFYFLAVLSLTTGAMFLIWLGKLIDDHGIGNGISIIIMAGIIARLPQSLGELVNKVRVGEVHYTAMVVLLAVFIFTVVGVVFIQQGQRRIPVQQAKHTRGRRVYGGQRHFMPLRVNMAGVIPIIFASSLLIFPRMFTQYLGGRDHPLYRMFEVGGYLHVIFYIALTFFFCFFWNSLIFNPSEMANNMKEYGSFIPGIRPGKKTANYLEKIITKITLAGAAFLAFIAVFPELLFSWAQLAFVFFLGGTSMLIVVGVALDVVQKVESHLLMRHYKGFMGSGHGIRGRRT